MRDNCSYLNRSIAKHGWSNFKWWVVEQGWMTQDERDQKEIALIAKLGFYGGGYNQTKGGRGSVGCRVSAETRAKQSAVRTGKKQSLETIEKRARKLRGRTRPKEVMEKCCAKLRKRYRGRRKDGNGEWVNFTGMTEGMQLFGCTQRTISLIINNKVTSRYWDFERLSGKAKQTLIYSF